MNNGTGDDRPVTAFYHETETRSENGEEVMASGTGSEKDKSKRKEDKGRPASEPEVQAEKANSEEGENDQSKMEGEETTMEATNKADEQKNPDDCLTAHTSEDSSKTEQTAAAPPASEEAPDVSDMLLFSIDSPGGACVASLSLMTLGLLSVFTSIPKQMVVVDSNLVDNDVVKR